MSDPAKAVFLSYASQDAEAARRICEALRSAGVEVWFDQSEPVGGDAWDQKIRRQIGRCALLVPIISANIQARREGYFRLKWRLAVERMRPEPAYSFQWLPPNRTGLAAGLRKLLANVANARKRSAGSTGGAGGRGDFCPVASFNWAFSWSLRRAMERFQIG